MQGINKLADPLIAEAVSPDGLIEAYRLDSEERFVLGVQWHPEWKVTETPEYQVGFDLFSAACRKRQ